MAAIVPRIESVEPHSHECGFLGQQRARAAGVELRAELPGARVTVSDLRTDPWDFAVTQ